MDKMSIRLKVRPNYATYSLLDDIRVMVIVWRLRGNIIGIAVCWIAGLRDTMFTVCSTLI